MNNSNKRIGEKIPETSAPSHPKVDLLFSTPYTIQEYFRTISRPPKPFINPPALPTHIHTIYLKPPLL